MQKHTKIKTVLNDLHSLCSKSCQNLSHSLCQLASADTQGGGVKRSERARVEKIEQEREIESEREKREKLSMCWFGVHWGKQQNTQKGKMGFTPVHQKCRQYWEQSSAISWVHKLIKLWCVYMHVCTTQCSLGQTADLLLWVSGSSSSHGTDILTDIHVSCPVVVRKHFQVSRLSLKSGSNKMRKNK